METTNRNGRWEKTPWVRNMISINVLGLHKGKMTSPNTQNVNLSSKTLSITKNRFLAWRTMRKMQKIVRETHNNFQLREERNSDLLKPPNHESMLYIHSTMLKWVFLAM